MKNIKEMTVREFKKLPGREHFDTPIECNALVILPSRHKHDSGWRMMDFVAVKDEIPICRCSGCSDILDIDGIGGYGIDGMSVGIFSELQQIKRSAWKIDCLPKSGLLRIFCNYKLKLGLALSDFEVFATHEKYDNDTQQMPF